MSKVSKKSSGGSKRKVEKKSLSPFAWVITAFAVVIVGILLINKLNEPEPSTMVQQAAVQNGSAGGSAAPGFSLPAVSGGSKSLSDYRGKVVMLNFWATWCGPCKREIPDFIEMQEAFRDDGFEIVGVSLDQPGEESKVAQFVSQAGINYDILHGNGEIAQAYGGVRSIPTTFLLDRDGNIVSSKVGLQPKSAWESQIKELL
ncbi:TlpA family protein disulfide reductase [bacterium]|nr:TlpA family protein disulfide reductase [bacterium]